MKRKEMKRWGRRCRNLEVSSYLTPNNFSALSNDEILIDLL
jgi:hypothetical protein